MKSKSLQPMPFGHLSVLRRLRMQGPDAVADATQDLGVAEPSLDLSHGRISPCSPLKLHFFWHVYYCILVYMDPSCQNKGKLEMRPKPFRILTVWPALFISTSLSQAEAVHAA